MDLCSNESPDAQTADPTASENLAKSTFQTCSKSAKEQADVGPRALKDPASVEFAWQTVTWLKSRFHSLSVGERYWQDALAEAEKYRIYERIPPGNPYGSLDALLKAEIGVDTETSKTVVRLRSMQAAQQTTGKDAPKKQGERTGLPDSGKLSQREKAARNKVGRDTQQKPDRLAKDFPELHERVKRGEISPHRSGIQAGFVKTVTPLDLLKRAWAKASDMDTPAMLSY